MKTSLVRILRAGVAGGMLMFCGTLSVPSMLGRAAEATAVAPVYTAAETREFTELANATIAALDAGKNAEMVAKLTDLETAWDNKEKTLKPKNSATWESLDKTLDKAISALRSSKTNLPKGKTALEDLIKRLAQATKS
jgi:hypothetical protein